MRSPERAQPAKARPCPQAGGWGTESGGRRRQPAGRRGADGKSSAKGMEKKRLHAAVRASEAAARLPPAGFPLW